MSNFIIITLENLKNSRINDANRDIMIKNESDKYKSQKHLWEEMFWGNWKAFIGARTSSKVEEEETVFVANSASLVFDPKSTTS